MTQFADAAERRRAPGQRLTDRQTAILELVASGLENKEIAHRVGISEQQQAVKEHVSTLLRLLSAPNRAALGTPRRPSRSSKDPSVFVAMNDAYRTTMGGADPIGMRYREAFPDRLESLGYLDRAYTSGERVVASGLQRRFTRAGSNAS